MSLWFLRTLENHIKKMPPLHPSPCKATRTQPTRPHWSKCNTSSSWKSTIKCKLVSIIRDPSIIPALKDTNERFNRVTYEGAKVLQLYILSKLESGNPLPIMDQNFIRRS